MFVIRSGVWLMTLALLALAVDGSGGVPNTVRAVSRGGAGGKKDWVCEDGECKLRYPKRKSGKKGTKDEDEDVPPRLAFHKPKSLLKRIQLMLFSKASDSVASVTGFLRRLLGFGSPSPTPAKASSKAPAKASPQAKTKTSNPSAAAAASTGRRGRRRGGPPRDSAATRIQRELRDLTQNAPSSIEVNVREDNINVWVLTLHGVPGTVFEGEKHKLRVEFPRDYPAKPPSVYFLKPTPRHPHVYTNGDICLDLLGKGWKPQVNVRTLALSILSMLSSAKEKGIPPDNSQHADSAPGRPQEGWLYHDDHC